MMALHEVVIGVVLLLLSGFFSGSETALFSLPRYIARAEAERRTAIGRIITHPRNLLAMLLLGNMFVNLFYAALSLFVAQRLGKQSGVWAFGVAELAALLLLVLFGEILPKVVAMRSPRGFARFAAPVLLHLRLLVGLPAVLLAGLAKALVKAFLRRVEPTSDDALPYAIEEAATQGLLPPHIARMLKRVARLRGLRVADIMTPRVRIVWFDVNRPREELVQLLKTCGHRKLPACDGDIEKVVGIIHAKDVFLYPERSVTDLVREVLFVPEVQPLDIFLRTLIKRAATHAIVVDEFGSVAGLATLEDAVEEVVGEIEDEHDERRVMVRRLDEGGYLLRGDATLRDWEDAGGERLKASATTISGFLAERLGRLPQKGDTVETADFLYRVLVAGKEGALRVYAERKQ